jgi:hypothetical protein
MDYVEAKGYFSSLVFNSQLPSKVTGGARLIGIDNKGTRANGIIDYMTELLRNYHDRMFISIIFEQLTTFVQDLSKSGKEVWGPMNRLMHFDDVLYAIVYAYICRLSHPNLQPIHKDAVSTKTILRHKLMRTKDWDMVREPVRVPVYTTSAKDNLSSFNNED